jgi:5'(3')-deoxyribonucleotidase
LSKQKLFKIGFDLDGVVADFNQSFIKRLEKVSGKTSTLPHTEEPPCWAYPTAIGFSEEDERAAWNSVKNDPGFWLTLDPLFEAQQALSVLSTMYNVGHEVYFMTTRMGVHPHLQSMTWLELNGFPNASVLISSNKGPVAQGLALTHFIDDKPENCFDVDAACNPTIEFAGTKTKEIKTKVYLFRRKWNDYPKYMEPAAEAGITVVTSLRDFFEHLIKEESVNAIVV